MGSGTDHLAFLQRAGVPCIDQRFIRDNVLKLNSFFFNLTF